MAQRKKNNVNATKVPTAKAIEPAPTSQSTASELRNWYQKNKKSIENYAQAMEGARSLRDITKTSTKTVTAFNKDSLRSYLQNIGSNEKKS